MIGAFRGNYRFLSNFWPAEVELDGALYPSVEHAYQAAKTLDTKLREQIQEAETAAKAKRLGQRIKLRPDWEEIKYDVMYYLVRYKFFHSSKLQRLLIATGKQHLEEGNTWGDKTWGTVNGEGKNWLGQILMKVRSECESAS